MTLHPNPSILHTLSASHLHRPLSCLACVFFAFMSCDTTTLVHILLQVGKFCAAGVAKSQPTAHKSTLLCICYLAVQCM